MNWLPIIQAGIGLGQGIGGMMMGATNQRPEYEIPESQKNALGLQASYASQNKMPGQTIAEENIAQNQANMLTAMKEMGGTPSSVAALSESTNEAYEGLGARASMWQTGEKDKYLSQLGTMAGYEDKAWQLNEYQPFQDKAAASSALIGSGMQNIMGAAKSHADFKGAQDYQAFMNKLYGINDDEESGGGSFGGLNVNNDYGNTVPYSPYQSTSPGGSLNGLGYMLPSWFQKSIGLSQQSTPQGDPFDAFVNQYPSWVQKSMGINNNNY